MLAGTAGLSERLFGDEELTGATAGDVSFAVMHGLYWLAANLAGRQPTVLVIDDLHWADDVVVRVRMGLHTGEASVGTDGYVGFAVHQAARIGDAGHGGQVLLSSTTANLVRHDLPGELGLLDLGPSVLPDFDRPERLFQLEIPGLALKFPPLSTREREKARPRIPRRRTDVQVSSRPLLEREADVATLQAVVNAAAGGAGRVVAIEGRAGMGKTRLVAEARSLAESAGFEVLLARSADLEQGLPQEIFANPKQPRTQQFLERIIEAGRL